HADVSGLGGRALAPTAFPAAQRAAARRRHPDVGTVDVRALSAMVMVHPRSELHLGRRAARRRARGVSRHPTSTGTATDMTFAARRTIYVFTDRGADRGVERVALGGASQGGVYEAYHARETIDPSIGRRPELVGQAQWDLLRRVIEERDPHTIAVDISHTHAF